LVGIDYGHGLGVGQTMFNIIVLWGCLYSLILRMHFH